MAQTATCLLRRTAFAACVLIGVRAPLRSAPAAASKYQTDLAAFFQELDRSYPFFDLKNLRKGWPATKTRILLKARRCSSDEEFLVLDAIRYLRDGHMGFAKANAQLPEAEPTYYPGISFMPATKKRVIVMAAVEAHAATLKPGTVVTHIDRKPARAFLEVAAQKAWAEGGSSLPSVLAERTKR